MSTVPARKLADGPIDVHAHVVVPEIWDVTRAHSVFTRPPEGVVLSEEARTAAAERVSFVIAAMGEGEGKEDSDSKNAKGGQIMGMPDFSWIDQINPSFIQFTEVNKQVLKLIAFVKIYQEIMERFAAEDVERDRYEKLIAVLRNALERKMQVARQLRKQLCGPAPLSMNLN
jgi:hypothetical protein